VRNSAIWAQGDSSRYAIHVDGTSTPGFVSDYNNLFAADGAKAGYFGGDTATLAQWQSASGGDLNSISKNALFADPHNADMASRDYHLLSPQGRWLAGAWVQEDTATSPAIDRGDPASDASQEPAPNGGRINMGAYGGSPQASLTPPWLNLAQAGAGSGQVEVAGTVRNLPHAEGFATGSVITLTALPGGGSTFTSWAGAVTGTSETVTLTMDGDKAATVTFELLWTLSVLGDGSGDGQVDVNGTGHALPHSDSFLDGAVVSLTAQPDAWARFDGWSGAVSSSASAST